MSKVFFLKKDEIHDILLWSNNFLISLSDYGKKQSKKTIWKKNLNLDMLQKIYKEICYTLWENIFFYVLHSHCMTSRLNCWRAPIETCFTSLSKRKFIRAAAICLQDDMQAVCATLSYKYIKWYKN